MKSNPNRLWVVAFALGWAFDLLFWKQSPGVNFAIYMILCLAGGLYLLLAEGVKPARQSLWLLIPILFFAVVSFVRAEPLTSFLAHALTLFLMAVFVITYLGGRWIWYGVWDYALGFLRLGGNMLVKPVGFASEVRKVRLERGDPPKRSAWPVVRGLVIALPIVAIFAALLSSADVVFNARLKDVLDALNLDNIPEYIFRLSYILVFGYLFAGIFLHAAANSTDEKLLNEKPMLGQFLGFIEAAIVLGSVAILFASFVVIQFQYFFGGQANIHIGGYTYSEYARKGFGELIAVAFFSLLMILGLGAITRRETATQRKIFSGLSIGIVVLVLVMLVSAYRRLILYETAYGFSEARTYAHVFMIWLGALLVVTVALEILHRERMFALAALIASLGFAATLPILNVDAFIVHQNVQRVAAGNTDSDSNDRFDNNQLDVSYFTQLSADALPALVDSYRSPNLPAPVHDALGATLACILYWQRDSNFNADWRSYQVSRWEQRRLLDEIRPELGGYLLSAQAYPLTVTSPKGNEYNCGYANYMD